jgi:ribose transport system substrate-binding protein
MKPILAVLVSLGAAALGFAADPLQIAVIPKSVGNEYWEALHAGALKAEADLNAEGVPVKVSWEGTPREDMVEPQKQIVAKYVSRKVNAIVLGPLHSQALIASVDEATAAHIPVVLIDSPLAGGSAVSTVATNNYKAGMLAGKRLGEVLGGKGKVALFRFMKGHGSTQPRESGFLDAIKKFPGIEVVSANLQAGATIEEATTNAKALLTQFGSDLQGVFASNLVASNGMLAALRETGSAGKIAFVGFDANDVEVEALRKGEMVGIAVQQPFMMGYLGVRTAVAKLQGKPVDQEVDTDVKIVTKENLETPEVKKLLNPTGA